MKYLLVIFALIFVGCSEYPKTKIACKMKNLTYEDFPELNTDYAYKENLLFRGAEIEISGVEPPDWTNTYTCNEFSQDDSSWKCQFEDFPWRTRTVIYDKFSNFIIDESKFNFNRQKDIKEGFCTRY
tara:strand:+ start:740 stop:1120 length:381 start_codon:yes stop_codon:yes gene_type:complete